MTYVGKAKMPFRGSIYICQYSKSCLFTIFQKKYACSLSNTFWIYHKYYSFVFSILTQIKYVQTVLMYDFLCGNQQDGKCRTFSVYSCQDFLFFHLFIPFEISKEIVTLEFQFQYHFKYLTAASHSICYDIKTFNGFDKKRNSPRLWHIVILQSSKMDCMLSFKQA